MECPRAVRTPPISFFSSPLPPHLLSTPTNTQPSPRRFRSPLPRLPSPPHTNSTPPPPSGVNLCGPALAHDYCDFFSIAERCSEGHLRAHGKNGRPGSVLAARYSAKPLEPPKSAWRRKWRGGGRLGGSRAAQSLLCLHAGVGEWMRVGEEHAPF